MKYGLMSWSGGKDSALAYYRLKSQSFKIVSLLTNVIMPANETPIHRIPYHMIELQAMQMGLPVVPIYQDEFSDNASYESHWSHHLEKFESLNLDFIAEGDISQDEIIGYKKYLHGKLGYESSFVLEGLDSYEVVKSLINLGFKAKIIAIDANHLSKDWVGQEFDQMFLAELPPTLDPAGEDGSFHTFIYDGPLFKRPLHIEFGEIYAYQIQTDYSLNQWNIKMKAW